MKIFEFQKRSPRKLTHQRGVDLARSLLDEQLAFNGALLEVNNKIQQRSHLGRHATLCRDEHTECQQKFA